jgi:hypothetical protein
VLFTGCSEGNGLLQTYLIALARYEETLKVPSVGLAEIDTVMMAGDWLTMVRKDYWRHVEKHKCRTERKDTANGL